MNASVENVIACLRQEPAWIVAAVLFAAHWPWRDAVLRALPAKTRLDLAHYEKHRATLTSQALGVLLASFADAIEAPRSEEQALGLAAWIAQIRAVVGRYRAARWRTV